jgi:hypothetical protein
VGDTGKGKGQSKELRWLDSDGETDFPTSLPIPLSVKREDATIFPSREVARNFIMILALHGRGLAWVMEAVEA